MPSIEENLESQSTQLQASLQAGVDSISEAQQIVFTRYVKLILPLDGYVFWVRADLVSQSALTAAVGASAMAHDNYYPASGFQPDLGDASANSLTVAGSLHYASQTDQREDETAAINSVVFTSTQEIQQFNQVGPTVMYIAEFDGIRFAFNRRGMYYQQAGIHHYSGFAVYPALKSQMVDDITGFDSTNVIVSNSLPIWLSINLNQFLPIYPSFLVNENAEPPYASVHIPPDSTVAIGQSPRLDRKGSHSQLVSEKVRITLYGMRNFSALDFLYYILQYSLDHPSLFGITNMPVIRDEKRTQSELSVIAQKKTFELEVNYYQQRTRNLARKYILGCIPGIIVKEDADFDPVTNVNINTSSKGV